MANEFVGFDIHGVKELEGKLTQLPQAAADAGADEANGYLLNVFRIYPQYTYVSVQDAGGWKSEKQRRYVMAQIRKGVIQIPYRRTQTFQRGWKKIGAGAGAIIANETPYGPWLVDNDQQARGMRMRGWDKIALTLQGRAAEIVRHFDAGVQKAIRKLGL